MIHILGTWQNRVDVAIKQLRYDRMQVRDPLTNKHIKYGKDEFFKDAWIFKLINHPNLVQVRIVSFLVL